MLSALCLHSCIFLSIAPSANFSMISQSLDNLSAETPCPTACSPAHHSSSFTHTKSYSRTTSTSHLTNPCKRTEGASTKPTTTRSTTYCASACSTSTIFQKSSQMQCTVSTYPSLSSNTSQNLQAPSSSTSAQLSYLFTQHSLWTCHQTPCPSCHH